MDAEETIAALVAQLLAKDAIIAELRAEVLRLGKVVEELTEKLAQNSRNSHKPPSSDPPGSRQPGLFPQSRRPRGGQKGHKGNYRSLLPADQVSEFVDLFPPACESCWKPLPAIPDADATRTQITEVPQIKPHVKEFRQHAVACPCCDYVTRATGEGVIPSSPFGPRLMALVVLFTGIYHLSRRRTVEALSDILGVRLSLGAASSIEERVGESLKPAFDDVFQRANAADVKHTDATAWLQGGTRLCLWTIATSAVTVFKIVADGTASVLRPLFTSDEGILVSDRATVFTFWKMKQRQVCWAHLLRKFVSFSERGGQAGSLGDDLVGYAHLVFKYWHDYKGGVIDRPTFLAWMAPVRDLFEACVERAAASGIDRLAGSCEDILRHREALWTFMERDNVDPTNNHAERELREFVLWRKRSFGTQSDRGNRFAERVMTIAHTARKQKRNVFAFLTSCCEALQAGTPPPLLLQSA